MAQKLRDDKIGQLTHSAGNITMAASSSNPAYLTIGGQQYKITSNLIVALPSMTANSRYQVFAVLNAGVVELRISQNENSVGPAGFARWKLVGSLYSNGLGSPSFGSFVNIKGTPETSFIPGGVIQIVAQSGGLVKGTNPTDRMFWKIKGNVVNAYYELTQNSAGAAGTGNYLITVPFAIDTNKYNINTDGFSGTSGTWNAYSQVGKGHVSVGTSPGFLTFQPYSATQFRSWALNISTAGSATPGGWGSNFFTFANTDLEFSGEAVYESSALTNTPIEDR